VLANDSIFLFGGIGYADILGNLNDLWRYDLLGNQWFFINGNQTSNVETVYSTLGDGYPGSRYGYSLIKLLNDSLILFGGSSNGYPINELWRFDLETNDWYFVNGNETINAEGVYSTLGDGYPGGRYYVSMSLLSNNSIILFAGGTNSGSFNDMWRFDPLSNEWYFVEGFTFVFSSVSELENGYPVARDKHSISTLSDNSIILFGGDGIVYNLNDLWIYPTESPSSSSSESPSSSSSESPSSSSSENPSSISSSNTPTSTTTTTSVSTSSTSSKSSAKPTTTTKHVNTESSNISKLLPTIFMFIFFFN